MKGVFAEAAECIEPTSLIDAKRPREATPQEMRPTFATSTAERLAKREDLTVRRDRWGPTRIATTHACRHPARGMAIAVTAEDLA